MQPLIPFPTWPRHPSRTGSPSSCSATSTVTISLSQPFKWYVTISNTVQRYSLTTPGRPCDQQGNFLPQDARPPARDLVEDYTPFENRPAFEFAELLFKRIQASKGNIDDLLRSLAAYNVTQNGADAPFDSADDLLATIDTIPYGDAPWESFSVRYTGAVNEDSPSWKRAEFVVHCRNARTVAHNIIGMEELDGKFDITPYQEYLPDGSVCYSNLMSGEHAYTQAVCFFHRLPS